MILTKQSQMIKDQAAAEGGTPLLSFHTANGPPAASPNSSPSSNRQELSQPRQYDSDSDESGPSISSTSPAEKQVFRRSYKACVHCRAKKIKCDLGDLANPSNPPCARCRREGKECIFAESRRGGVGNVRAGRKRKAKGLDDSEDVTGSASSVISPAASLSGSVAQQTLASGSGSSSSKSNSILPSSGHLAEKRQHSITGRELHNTSDALEILAHAARSFPKIESTSASSTPRPGSPSGDGGTNTPLPKGQLAEADVVAKEKFLTEQEALSLINFYFDKMDPFYPFIPDEIKDPSSLSELPILLATILTLSSRYCKLPENPDYPEPRSVHLHSRLWVYTQQMISQTVWAEASTRSIGTVYSFLLFSEWNPRAIHSRAYDYANKPPRNSSTNHLRSSRSGTSRPGPPPLEVDVNAGLASAKRSDRMAWLLIGSAIRLAQDLRLMETNPKVYLATHLSEAVLALRIGRRSMLAGYSVETIPKNLHFTEFESAKLGLIQIMSLAHESLYLSRATTRDLLQGGRYLGFLGLFGPHLENWENSNRHLFEVRTLDRESLLFDYHYSRLYIYSLALSNSSNPPTAMTAEIITASRYVAMATDSAREVLAVVSRVDDMGFLARSPIRWLVRIVHAMVFLVKSVLLTPPSNVDVHRPTILLIQRVATTLRDSSVDDLHLSTRYGTLLINLCSELLARTIAGSSSSSATGSKYSHKPTSSNNRRTKLAKTPQQLASSSSAASSTRKNSVTSNPQSTPDSTSDLSMPPAMGPPLTIDSSASPVLGQTTPQGSVKTEDESPLVQPDSQQLGYLPVMGCLDGIGNHDESLMSMLEMNFDFLMEGSEGLGFVEPLMEGIEQQQIMQQQQRKENFSY